jgi:hypothetical protein
MHGEVACASHTPSSDDPRWTKEGWAPMAVADVQGHVRRYQYQCQYCARDGRAIRRIPE